jgi:hypothetical protein
LESVVEIAVVVIVPGAALGQTGLLQQALAEHVLVGAEDRFQGGLPAGRQVVLDLILALGDGNLVAGPEGPDQDALPVYLDPVGAAQVPDLPEPGVLERQFAVQAGDVWELQADVTRLAAAAVGSGRRRRPEPILPRYPLPFPTPERTERTTMRNEAGLRIKRL